MAIDLIKDLEKKVNRAISLIGDLRENKQKIEKENEALNRKLENTRAEFEEYKKTAEARIKELVANKPDFNVEEVKNRLSKLSGKLAALEDSWT